MNLQQKTVKTKKLKIVSVFLLFLALSGAVPTNVSVFQNRVQAEVYNVNPSVDEELDCSLNSDTGNAEASTSTQNETSSAGASDTDWAKEGTVAYKNAKNAFETFTSAGLSGEASAGIIGWVNSEGGWFIVDRAEGHFGNDPKTASISEGVTPNGFVGYAVGGGGIYQFTPYTKFAKVGDKKWKDAGAQTAFVLESIKNGDWNASMDMSGKNQTFEQFAKNTNITETALGWQAYERGNPAYIPKDAKVADAKKANEVFNKSKIKFNEKKFNAFFGGNAKTSEASDKDTKTSKETKKSDLPSEASEDWKVVLVNRENKKEEMSPSLAKVGSIEVDSRIKDNVTKFLEEAKKIDGKFHLISGYRSVETQKGLYDSYVKKEMASGLSKEEAEKKVQTYSQPAGASEHQTGLAIDISTIDSLNEMSQTTADKLKKLAEKHGFVRRFEESKKSSTGVGFEDWHYRFVGIENAKYMNQHNLSLEEYVEKIKSDAESGGDSSDACGDTSSGEDTTSNGGTGEWSKDKTGKVNYRQFNSWKAKDLPSDLKPYAVNPESVGMTFNDTKGWQVKAYSFGQCTDFSASFMYALWEKGGQHPRMASGNGSEVAGNWAVSFGGKITSEPSAGAVFSTGDGSYGHTGVVSHVFENGDTLIVEQNFLGYSGDFSNLPKTWNYRYVPKSQIESENWRYYSPKKAGYKIVSNAKSK